MGLLRRMLNKAKMLGGGSGSSGTHEHFAGEFGSSGRGSLGRSKISGRNAAPSTKKAVEKRSVDQKSSGRVLRAQQSMKKARAAHERAKTAKTGEERAKHAAEAKRHAENARLHLLQANSAKHADHAESLRQSAERTHRRAHEIAKSAATQKPTSDKNAQTKTPDKKSEPRRPTGPIGPFGLMSSQRHDHAKIHAEAKSHLDKATDHLASRDTESASGADKVRHAMSALASAKKALETARKGDLSGEGGRIAEKAARVAQSARETIAKSDTTTARRAAEIARTHHEAARKASRDAAEATGTAQKLHKLAATAHRRKATAAAKNAVKYFEATGEGVGHYEEMRAMLAKRKKRKT